MEPWFLENEVLRISGNYELVLFTAAVAVLEQAAQLEELTQEEPHYTDLEDLTQCLFGNEG